MIKYGFELFDSNHDLSHVIQFKQLPDSNHKPIGDLQQKNIINILFGQP